MDEMIRTEAVSKRFGRVTAVDGVSMSVRKGEIYGFLGLNGAGKTTTIRMLLGMIRPTTGSVYLKGETVSARCQDLWHHVGYLVEIPYSYPELTVWENLEIVRRLRLLREGPSIDWIIEKLRLGPYRNRRARHLSLGNAQRLGLAKAIMHEPEILILDEPSNGLDPAGIVEIRELLVGLARDQGVTIFISSHILGEIAKFATRIGIIHNGRLVQESDSSQLEGLRNRTLIIGVSDTPGAVASLAKHGIEAVCAEEGVLHLHGCEVLRDPARINSMLVDGGYPPSRLSIEEEDLESYFLRVIGAKEGAR